jgi:hypothetical protein
MGSRGSISKPGRGTCFALPLLLFAVVALSLPPHALAARPSYGDAPAGVSCAPSTCVHWARSGGDAPDLADANGDGVPDLVEQVRGEVERTRQRQTVASPAGLGWRTPVSDGDRGGTPGGEVDVYLLHRNNGFNGEAWADDGACPATGVAPRVCSGSIRLDTGLRGAQLREVVAHEFNHLVSYAYGYGTAQWLFEATAVWMSDKANDAVKTWVPFVGQWAQHTEESMLSLDAQKKYGDVVWLQWLDRRYGPALLRNVWEQAPPEDTATGYGDGPLRAFDASIRGHGGVGFIDEFVRFASALPEWRDTPDVFGDGPLFPDVERVGDLVAGEPAKTLTLSYPSFALLDVPVPAPGTLRVTATFGDGDAGGVALVARYPRGGDGAPRIVSDVHVLDRGGTQTAVLDIPPHAERVTAVLTNAQMASKPGTTVSPAVVRADFVPLPATPGAAPRSLAAGATGATDRPDSAARSTVRPRAPSRSHLLGSLSGPASVLPSARRIALRLRTAAGATVAGRVRLATPGHGGRPGAVSDRVAVRTDLRGDAKLTIALGTAARRYLRSAACRGAKRLTLEATLKISAPAERSVVVRRRITVRLAAPAAAPGVPLHRSCGPDSGEPVSR